METIQKQITKTLFKILLVSFVASNAAFAQNMACAKNAPKADSYNAMEVMNGFLKEKYGMRMNEDRSVALSNQLRLKDSEGIVLATTGYIEGRREEIIYIHSAKEKSLCVSDSRSQGWSNKILGLMLKLIPGARIMN